MLPVQVRLPAQVVANLDRRAAEIRKQRSGYTRSDLIRDALGRVGTVRATGDARPFWELAAKLSRGLRDSEQRRFPADLAAHHREYRRRVPR